MVSDLFASTASLQHSSSLPAQSSPPLSISNQIGIFILVLAFVIGFPGNLFLLWSLVCRVRQRSVTCLLVLNLTVADTFLLLSVPLFLRFLSGRRGWEFGAAACKTIHYLCCVNMNVSIYLICLMSIDRWLAVTKPFLSQKMRTKQILKAVLLGIWVLAFVMALPMPFYRSNLQMNSSITICMPYHWNSVGHQVFQYLFETIMGFILPFTLIIACYCAVLCRLRTAMLQRKGRKNRVQRGRRGNRLILLIIGAFAVCWLPYHIVNILQVTGLLSGTNGWIQAALVARPNTTAFAFLSSSANPLLCVLSGCPHIRGAGFGFMAELFEATNPERRTSSLSHSTRSSRCGSSALDDSFALRKLSLKPGRRVWCKEEDVDDMVTDGEVMVKAELELKTLASNDQLK